MKEISLTEFLEKYEEGFIKEVVVIKSKVYGRDSSYTFERAEAGKISEIVWANIT